LGGPGWTAPPYGAPNPYPYGAQPPYGRQPPFVPTFTSGAARRGRINWRSKWTIPALGVSAAVIALAIALPLTLGSGPPPAPPLSPSALARLTAHQVNLRQADVPAGWTVDASATGPLSGFLGTTSKAKSGTKTGSTSSGKTSAAKAQANQAFKACLGVPATPGSILGGNGPPPLGEASSPAFSSPSTGSITLEAGSSTTVFGSDAEVATGKAMLEMPKFPQCFGAYVGDALVNGGGSGPTKATFGTPHVVPFAVPSTPGVTSVGVDVTVPVTGTARSTSVQLGIVLFADGRVESALFTFALGTTFPASLTASLASTLAQRVATASTAVST